MSNEVSFSMVAFIERYFRTFNESGEWTNIRLSAAQQAVVNAIEFGYDITTTSVQPKRVPKGVIMNWPRGFGKTFSVACTIAALLVLESNIRIGATATDEGLAKEIRRLVSEILRSNPDTAEMIQDDNILSIVVRRPDGSVNRLTCHPHSESIRGRHFHYLFIDEAAKYDQVILESAVMHTARRLGRRWIMLSTPRGSMIDTYFGRKYLKGVQTRPIVCKNCGENYSQDNFPHITFSLEHFPSTPMPPCAKCGGVDYEYGVGTYGIIPVDPFNCPWKSEEEVRRELEEAGNTPLARQEILGEFIESSSTVFRDEWIQSAIAQGSVGFLKPIDHVYYIMGVDFGKYHDAACFVITHQDGDRIILDYMETKKASTVSSQKWDYADVRDDILRLVRTYHVSAIVPDATGVGDAVLEDLQRDLQHNLLIGTRLLSNNRHGLGFVSGGNKQKSELVSNLERLFTKGKIVFPQQEQEIYELRQELIAFSYEVTQSLIKYGTQNANDDRVLALALACWGHTQGRWLATTSSFDGEYMNTEFKRHDSQSQLTSSFGASDIL